jgi:DNA-binding response OmpR family regulator
MRILLIDDDEIFIDILQKNLEDKNYVLDVVNDGEQGWIYGSTYTYDLIILSWHLPKLDGISLCHRFRTNGDQTPILLLTASHRDQDKIVALDSGADDCLFKSFNFEELTARIRALLRRSHSNSLSVLTWGDLQLDTSHCQVTYQGEAILLTAKEYQLLELFMGNEQEIFNIEEIIENLWSSLEYPSKATVRSHLRYLRQKLKQAGLPEDPIETLKGRGYCLKSWHKASNSLTPNVNQNHSINQEVVLQQERYFAHLNTTWQKYRSENYLQLELLQEVLEDCEKGHCTVEQQEQVRFITYNLARTMRVFGFEETSRLASELEELLNKNIFEDGLLNKFKSILTDLCRQLNIDDSLSEEIIETSPLILIVNHDLEFREILTPKIMAMGMRTAITPSVKSAQTWLQDLPKEQRPYVAIIRLYFTNLSTNVESLEDYLSLITELNSYTPSIPVIVIADRDRFEDRLLVRQHGATFLLKQPITPEEAIAFCQKALKRSSRDKKIMIVDDDIDLLRYLPAWLEPWGFIVTTLDDPRQFWDVLEAVQPDLLVLDVEMPYLSGMELCQVIRSHPSWYKLPILYLNVYQQVEIRKLIFTTGADDFLQKPFTDQQLAESIIHCLKRSMQE